MEGVDRVQATEHATTGMKRAKSCGALVAESDTCASRLSQTRRTPKVNSKVADFSRDAAVAFLNADVDGNQRLTFDEFAGINPKNSSVSKEQLQELFRAIDADGSGDISMDEYFLYAGRPRTQLATLPAAHRPPADDTIASHKTRAVAAPHRAVQVHAPSRQRLDELWLADSLPTIRQERRGLSGRV